MLGKQLQTAAAGNAGGDKLYVEDVFSTYLYTGNGSTQTITNGIDLAGEGGMVWIKGRDQGTQRHMFVDSERSSFGAYISSNLDSAQAVSTAAVSSVSSSGFTVGSNYNVNSSSDKYTSWTFRKAPKFFDVVTYVGDGTTGRSISHNLGSVPGCVIIKCTDTVSDWIVWHRSLNSSPTGQKMLFLNRDYATQAANYFFYGAAGTLSATEFGGLGPYNESNVNGQNYVAYFFAHDAGGFGDDGSESVIKCGSYTATGNAQTVNLGWEPQFIIIKSVDSAQYWGIWDNMRGVSSASTTGSNQGGTDYRLYANTAAAEQGTFNFDNYIDFTSTGFIIDPTNQGYFSVNNPAQKYIYIAIRRGPMNTIEDPTKLFDVSLGVIGNGWNGTTPELQGLSLGFAPDMTLGVRVNSTTNLISGQFYTNARLTDRSFLEPRYANAESTSFGGFVYYGAAQTDIAVADAGGMNDNLFRGIFYNFRRAPGFFDVVTYSGTGAATQAVAHNLGVAPELIIVKCRSNSSTDWAVKHDPTSSYYLQLNSSVAEYGPSSATWSTTNQDSSNFYVGISAATGASGRTFVAYLFATLPGVSKVGSYTGTGSTINVNCGFTAGARFVMIKRTDSTGEWYIWDTVRGINSGNEPYMQISSTAETTGTNYINPLSTGFQITSSGQAEINANGGSYIFLAIA